ncbi:MAG: cupin domain-containing protein [Acidobacteria bacterium]|nr:cupin domain-containing protein [Acidobacteriota bacterium]NIM60696.1 cupin domain-containing protein [Acidobacteriota bacterium]NIO58656.1 cupin domain-containing protein [Acidobacteriota bacterium]NIQ29712.1 cupin domain-containing protein [Acidobacteriota bacterium]NIQ84429.1 cupin domain-containing protein [Acidobacteriota bacterium]
MPVERWNAERDGEPTERALREKLEARGYSVSCYTYPPGTYFPDHTHAVDKIDAVLSGRFRLILEGEEAVLEAGDCIEVPRGAVHSAEVVGDEPVVSLDAIRG